MREVAIHISNHTMHKFDRGVIVVGASTELGDLASRSAAGELPIVLALDYNQIRSLHAAQHPASIVHNLPNPDPACLLCAGTGTEEEDLLAEELGFEAAQARGRGQAALSTSRRRLLQVRQSHWRDSCHI